LCLILRETFFSNAAHRLLTQAGFGNNVGIVAVATPAGIVEGGGPHVTAPEDLVIKAVRILSLGIGVLPANAGNMTRPRNADWFNHNFIRFYMQGIETGYFIIQGIVLTIDGVNGVGGLQYPGALGGRNFTLDGVLPNAAAAAALQYAVASEATAYPGVQPPSVRLLNTGAGSLTISTCTGSSFSINQSLVRTSAGRDFLMAMGYNQDRWRFNSVGPSSWNYGPTNRIDSAMSFPSLAELRAYADPRLFGTYFSACGINKSLQQSTRVFQLSTTGFLNIYELFNPNGIKRCNWSAIYEAYPYFDGFGALMDDYYVAGDKQAWADGLLIKAKAYYTY